jgi:hypothetical protein
MTGCCPYKDRCQFLHDLRVRARDAKARIRTKNQEEIIPDAHFWPVMDYNLVNRKLDMKNIVKPAPTRLSLKLFGGYMDIKEFRNFNTCNKLVNINFPPMNSLSQQIEEINEFEVNNDFRYIPIDNDRINKIKEKMI